MFRTWPFYSMKRAAVGLWSEDYPLTILVISGSAVVIGLYYTEPIAQFVGSLTADLGPGPGPILLLSLIIK